MPFPSTPARRLAQPASRPPADPELARFERRAALIDRVAADADRWTTRLAWAVTGYAALLFAFHAVRYALRIRGLA